MFNNFKTIFLLTLVCTLTACASLTASKNEDEKRTKTAVVNAQLGMAYLQKQDISLAKQKLLLAVDQAPELPEVWYSMAYFMEVTGNKAQANTDYLKAISVAPQNGEAHNNYGTYLCRSGYYQAAIQQFLVAIEDKNYLNTAAAYENAGLCALKLPNAKLLAVTYFNKALNEDPNMPTSLIELAQYDYSQKNYTAAREKLREFLTIAPPTPESKLLSEKLGQTVGYLKNFDASKKHFV